MTQAEFEKMEKELIEERDAKLVKVTGCSTDLDLCGCAKRRFDEIKDDYQDRIDFLKKQVA